MYYWNCIVKVHGLRTCAPPVFYVMHYATEWEQYKNKNIDLALIRLFIKQQKTKATPEDENYIHFWQHISVFPILNLRLD